VKVWTATYTPFGGVHTSTGALPPNRFPGQWFQSESGLHQNWMRDYDPTTGRYLQADPLGLVDGASVYGYVKQSPMMLTDPRGEQSAGDVAELMYCLLNPSSCGTDEFPNGGTQSPQMCSGEATICSLIGQQVYPDLGESDCTYRCEPGGDIFTERVPGFICADPVIVPGF
jgi:RHS repeat-associated protein